MKKHTKSKWQEILAILDDNLGIDNPDIGNAIITNRFATVTKINDLNNELQEQNEKMRGVLKMMQDKRKHIGWDAECCALLADAVLTESLTPSKGQK